MRLPLRGIRLELQEVELRGELTEPAIWSLLLSMLGTGSSEDACGYGSHLHLLLDLARSHSATAQRQR